MGFYTAKDFDKSLLPKHFKADVCNLIETAAILGWRVHITSHKSVTIISPQDEKRYHFGLNSRASNNLNRIRKDLIKYGDPDKVVAAAQIIDPSLSQRAKAAASKRMPLLGEEGTVVDQRPETEPERPRPPRRQRPAPEPKPADVHVVSRKPMLAKSSEGKGYDSETTIERTYSDGTKDYVCAFKGCPFTSTYEDRLTVSRHYGAAHSAGQGRRATRAPYAADVPEAAIYRPQQRRVAALADLLAQIMRGGETDPEVIAREALMWVHEQSRRGTELSAEREDLSDSEVLNRIRTLLDDGEHGRLRTDLESAEERIAALSAEVEEAKRHAEAARSTLKAFTDLASELAQEEAAVG